MNIMKIYEVLNFNLNRSTLLFFYYLIHLIFFFFYLNDFLLVTICLRNSKEKTKSLDLEKQLPADSSTLLHLLLPPVSVLASWAVGWNLSRCSGGNPRGERCSSINPPSWVKKMMRIWKPEKENGAVIARLKKEMEVWQI